MTLRSCEPGKPADMIALDADPLRVDSGAHARAAALNTYMVARLQCAAAGR